MISVTVYKQSNCPASARKIGQVVKKTLEDHGLVSDSEVSVALVGEKRMSQLVKRHFKEEKSVTHPVLAFPASEIKRPFVFPPDGKIHLGEIVISYRYAVNEARKKGKLIDEVVSELAQHGALHLVGLHH